MSSGCYCAILDCKNFRRGNDYSTVFHSFPRSRPEILEKWILATGRPPSWFPSVGHRICSKHFAAEDYRAPGMGGRALLKHSAVPKLVDPKTNAFLPDELQPCMPVVDSNNGECVDFFDYAQFKSCDTFTLEVDHNYVKGKELNTEIPPSLLFDEQPSSITMNVNLNNDCNDSEDYPQPKSQETHPIKSEEIILHYESESMVEVNVHGENEPQVSSTMVDAEVQATDDLEQITYYRQQISREKDLKQTIRVLKQKLNRKEKKIAKLKEQIKTFQMNSKKDDLNQYPQKKRCRFNSDITEEHIMTIQINSNKGDLNQYPQKKRRRFKSNITEEPLQPCRSQVVHVLKPLPQAQPGQKLPRRRKKVVLVKVPRQVEVH